MPSSTEHADLVEAALAAIRPDAPSANLRAQVEMLEGDLARVCVSDLEGALTPIFGFFKQSARGWQALSLGTDFDQDFYQKHQIPEALRLK